MALQLKDHFLVSAYANGVLGEDLGFPALLLGEAGVHAKEVGSEEGGLVPTGAGPDLDNDVLFIARVARNQQSLDLLLKRLDAGGELLYVRFGEGAEVGITLRGEDLAGFLQALEGLGVFTRLHNDGLKIRTFLIDAGSAADNRHPPASAGGRDLRNGLQWR